MPDLYFTLDPEDSIQKLLHLLEFREFIKPLEMREERTDCGPC